MNRFHSPNLGLILLTTFLLCTTISISQENLGIPPSPTVASLVTVEKDSVNSSGRIVQNISLWDMALGEHSFPISLFYSSSGVKVEETPSYVGTGWNFSAGGVITRSVMDHPDDLMSEDHGSGILHTNIMNQIESFSNTIQAGGYNENASKNFFRYNINEDDLETRNDTQPDLFYFNFFNYSGKFLFNKNKEIVSLSNDNFKFSYTLDNVDHSLKTFTIIDTNGIEYLFAEREYSQTHYNSNTQWEFLSARAKRQRQLNYYSSWHLTQITTPDGLEMEFEYIDETLTYQMKDSEMGKICVDQQCEDTSINDTSNYDIQNSTASATTDFVINAKKISKITTDFFYIQFPTSSRQDLYGGHRLHQIIIRDLNHNLIDMYNFNYSYFISPNMPSTNNYEYKRLKLDNIFKNSEVFQEFEYYTDYALPHRKSVEQDFWGYFNDNNAPSLVPKIYTTFNGQSPEYHIFPPLNETVTYEFGNVDRNVNPLTIHMGMLKKITYKTDGYKEFFYEPNDFTLEGYTSGNSTLKGNGVRVDRIEYFDGHDVENLDYTYNSPDTGISSGRLSHLPKFATHIPWNYVYNHIEYGVGYYSPKRISSYGTFYQGGYWYWDNSQNPPVQVYSNATCLNIGAYGAVLDYSPTNYPTKYFAMTTRRFSSSQIALASNINDPLVYEYISVKEGNNGKKLYNFNVLGALDVILPTDVEPNRFLQQPSFKTNYWNLLVYNGQNLYQYAPPCPTALTIDVTESLNGFHNYFQYANLSGDSHPFAPRPNWNKYFGQLMNYTYLNEDGYKVYKEAYEYDLLGDTENSNTDKKIISLKYRLFDRPIGWGITSLNLPDMGPTAWIWSFYDIYYNIGLVPTRTTKTNYYNDELSNVIKVYDNEYAYGNFLRKTTHTNSEGDVLSTTFKYPLDFQSGNNLYNEMVQRNILYKNIEIIDKLNDNVTSAQVNEYVLSDSKILLKKSFQLETLDTNYNYVNAQPQPGTLNGVLNKDLQMVKKIEYDLFDARGKPIQYQTEDGVYHSIIWGYNKSYPIAQIDGVSYNNANSLFTSSAGLTFSYVASKSDIDINETSEQTLRNLLFLLRNSITTENISVKCATYDPLIGLTSVIDSRGKVTYYQYDNFNRLKSIKDHDGNIIEQMEYNYKNQY